jgi:hypothetical protein
MTDIEELYVPSNLRLRIQNSMILYEESFYKHQYEDVEKSARNTAESVGNTFENLEETMGGVEDSDVSVRDMGDHILVEMHAYLDEDADHMSIGSSAIAFEIIAILAAKSPGVLEQVLEQGSEILAKSAELRVLEEINSITGGDGDE